MQMCTHFRKAVQKADTETVFFTQHTAHTHVESSIYKENRNSFELESYL